MKNNYLDKEEQELIEAYETVDRKNIRPPSQEEQNKVKLAAKEFLKKETKMNIRIDPFELRKIKEFADNEGLKYQTFVKSIIHKYITGQLIEKRKLVK
jgi:predicted DNA binding CopG/RHH family protein